MFSLLNQISPTTIGLISLLAIILIVGFTIIFSAKAKKKMFLVNFTIGVASVVLAIFLAKPILSVFDKLFAFSSSMVSVFMHTFGNIPSMNNTVTSLNYTQAVVDFEASDVGVSSTIKTFLINVFENTKLGSGESTTLSLIASKAFSYLTALLLIAVVLSVVFFVILKLIFNLITRKKSFLKNDSPSKIVVLPLATIKGVFFALVTIIIFSSIPFISMTTDYLSTGFEQTKIFNTPYQWIVKTEQNIYAEQIDWQNVYSSSANKNQDLVYGVYSDTNEDSEYHLNIELIGDTLTQTAIIDGLPAVTTYKFVYSINKLQLFSIDSSSYVASYDYVVGEEQNTIKVRLFVGETIYSTSLTIDKISV